MRSIRRSLLGYLLLLLALALSAVGVLVDRFANAAVRTREASEVERIEQVYRLREQEAKSRAEETRRKFDAELLADAKGLARSVQSRVAATLGQQNPSRTEWLTLQAGTATASAIAAMGPNPSPLVPGSRPPGGGSGGGGGGGPGRFAEPQPPIKASEDDVRLYRARVALMEFATPPPPAALPALIAAWALEPRVRPGPVSPGAFADPRQYNPFPVWIEYDAPRVVERVADAVGKTFEDDDRAGFQITLGGGIDRAFGRPAQTFAVAHPARLAGVPTELPVEAAWFSGERDTEPKIDEIAVPGHGALRRVTATSSPNGRPMAFSFWLPAPPPLPAFVPQVESGWQAGRAVLPWLPPLPPLTVAGPPRQLPRAPHLTLRVVVQLVRQPAEVENRLAADQQERDDQLARVSAETQEELGHLRARLVVIGLVTFALLVLGGWFFVARGLSPLRALSDAVSRVSEKDFRLPVVPGDLGRELVPIHARISQTLTLLQRAFEREKQSVADISHELRTPIASLLATIDVALRKPRTPEQYRTTLEECRLISKQLGQLVERIMTLASLDAGNDHTHVTRTDGGDLATGCAAVIRPLAAANNLAVGVHVADEVQLDTDPGKLREVLMNLLHNAVEYNRPNGTIELTVRRSGASAVFEVRDTGIGMTPDVRERIFERFFRADSSRHATGVHAGLGLAIVKEYVARLNGTIAVESEPGAGTTFRVTLPAVTGDSAEVSAPRTKTPRGAVPAGS